MTPGMMVTAEFVLTFGVPVWLCLRPMGPTRGDPDRGRRNVPAPVAPDAPSPMELPIRPLPDCLMSQPGLAPTDRELEPV